MITTTPRPKDLNFAISPKKLNYADYMLPFELLFRDIDILDIPRTDRDFIQGRLLCIYII